MANLNIADREINWRTDILPKDVRNALDHFSKESWIRRQKWYLAGGTALALQVGHRRSVDLDFFTPQKGFSLGTLLGNLSRQGWETTFAREGTLYGKLRGGKVSFIAYPFFGPQRPFRRYGNIRVLAPEDIAVMKVIAVSQRGSKRDFIDLYWYVRNREALIPILKRLPRQYATVSHTFAHILTALMYFEDAEKDPMPRLFFRATWNGVKRYFRREVSRAARELLRL